MGFIIWLVVGGIVGWLASIVMKTNAQQGIFLNVIVGIVGNAVEHAVGVTLAAKGQSDLAISVIKNSVAQIAVFLFPALVLLSLLFETRLTFVVGPVYIAALLVTAIAMWQITGDGEAVAFEGCALVAIYIVLAVLTFYE